MRKNEREREPRRDITLRFDIEALWLASWLFTVGIADMPWWRDLFALLLWPLYLGDYAAGTGF